MEVERSPAADTFDKCQSMKDTVIPVTLSSPTNNSNNGTHDTISSKDPHLSSVASAKCNNQKSPSSVPVEAPCQSLTFASPLSIKGEAEATLAGLTQSDANLTIDMVSSRSSALVEVAFDELQRRQGANNNTQATQSNQKETWRSSEDGYSWRKYGQKHIKGSEFPRSYYRCSHPNCHVKKQVERSQNGRITDVLYKGQHDHPKPWSSNPIAASAIPSSQEEKYKGVSFSNNREDKTSNGHGETSPQAKQDGGVELSLVLASENNIERVGDKLIRVRDVVENDDDPELKRRRKLDTYASYRSKDPCHEQSLQADDCQSQANLSPCSIVDVNATVSPHELAPLSGNVPDSAVDVITSGSIVPYVESEDPGRRSDGGIQPVQHDHKEPSRFVTAERLWGDGYNWRKYGQKQIKGNEFPRSYYRCTHPNCKVKKQVERSHDGKDTEIIYKGVHDHPKPQPSSHMTVGKILSLQEDGSARVSCLSCTEDKSSNGHSLLTPRTDLNGGPGVSPITASDSNVLGDNSKSMQVDDQVERKDDSESNNIHLNLSKEINSNASVDSKDKQGKLSVEVQGQCQSQTLVSSPSAKKKKTDTSALELTPSTPNSNPPVYMVTARGIVPVEVDSDELRQRQSSDSAVQATQSDQNGISIAMTERLLENAYHWRKYGQKNIKGSEFPRSYYRCTYPNCSVKMQLERSHDGRIIEIIYKGKHDHPKPQPISRMAIGAILSLDEERSDRFSLTSTEEKPSNRHVQTPLHPNPNGLPELSLVTARDDNVECVGVKSNKTSDEVENDSDPEFKNRKGTSDMGTPIVRAPKEPRLVVETLTEFDVVDDGYRWQKYGRKMVKGNPYPRNYYRCSNAACPVKKHVERASHNPKAVITTYEGKHNHDIPAPRTISQDLVHKFASNDKLVTRSEEKDTISLDAGMATNSSPEQRSIDKQKIVDVVPLQVDSGHVKVIKPDLVSTPNGDSIDTSDPDKSRKDPGESFSFGTPSLNHSSQDIES